MPIRGYKKQHQFLANCEKTINMYSRSPISTPCALRSQKIHFTSLAMSADDSTSTPLTMRIMDQSDVDEDGLRTVTEGAEYTVLAAADLSRVWQCGNFMDGVWEFSGGALRHGVSVHATPPTIILHTSTKQDIQLLGWLRLSETCRADPATQRSFTRMYKQPTAPPATLRAQDVLSRCEPALPIVGTFLVTQCYTNQVEAVSMLGITKDGNAGVFRSFDCKARMEMRHGETCQDGSRNDEWHVYEISPAQYEACLDLWRMYKYARENDIKAFCAEQHLVTDEQAAHIWASDRGKGQFVIYCDDIEDLCADTESGPTNAERAYLWSLVQDSEEVFSCQTHG